MVMVRSILIMAYLLSLRVGAIISRDMDAKEPENEKYDSQPHTGAAGDDQNRHDVVHAVTRALGTNSRQTLEQRDREREHAQRSQRPEPNQCESPQRL